MYATDFEYDGKLLSEFGFVICNFDDSHGTNVVSIGSKITFNKVSQHSGTKYALTGTKYEECYQTTFDIGKDPCTSNDLIITVEECRDVVRWLNRHEFLKFHLIDNRDEFDYYFDSSFNVEQIKIDDELYGLRLNMETNHPFAYGDEIIVNMDFNSNSATILADLESELPTYIINNESDELGFIYPDITITCKSSGTLTITNQTYGCNMTIKNCSIGEVINICGSTQTIETSNNAHNICNDFNYEFLNIGNSINECSNIIAANIPCLVQMRYTPIIKLGL